MYDGYPSPSFLLVHGLCDDVHNDVRAAMVYGELQRMRSEGLVDGCWTIRCFDDDVLLSVDDVSMYVDSMICSTAVGI